MKCDHCHKKFDYPLELYNGELYCPHCYSALASWNLVFTDYNQELYNVSEMYFNNYLDGIKAVCQPSKTERKSQNKLRELLLEYRKKAIEYCSEAASLGNPCAVVKLGYYHWKNYIDSGMGSLGNYKVADKNFNIVYKSIQESTTGNWGKAREMAGNYLNEMLLGAPEELKEVPGIGEELRELAGRYDGYSDGVERIKSVLRLCVKKNNRHAPLFGYFIIEGNYLEELAAFYNDKSIISRWLSRSLADIGKVTVECAPIESGIAGEVIGDFSTNSMYVTNKDYREQNSKNRVCLYFYNDGCTSPFLSKNGVNRIKTLLADNGYEQLKEIILTQLRNAEPSKNTRECVFYADDIKYAARGRIRNVADIIKQLVISSDDQLNPGR